MFSPEVLVYTLLSRFEFREHRLALTTITTYTTKRAMYVPETKLQNREHTYNFNPT